LQDRIQASPVEIEKALKDINAFEYNGTFRALDTDYKKELLCIIIASINGAGLELETLSLISVIELLREDKEWNVPDVVVENILQSVSLEKRFTENGNIQFAVSPHKIGVFIAEYLFKQTSVWKMNEFYQRWVESIPLESLDIDFSMLDGLALKEMDATEEYMMLRYLPKSLVMSLAKGEVRRRFDVLFAIKRKW
jgi:hypothetical protein